MTKATNSVIGRVLVFYGRPELRPGKKAVHFVNRAPGSTGRLTLSTDKVPNVNRAAADGVRLTKCTLVALPGRGS